jgi:hypothetical protein
VKGLSREENLLLHEALLALMWEVGTGSGADDGKARRMNDLILKLRLETLMQAISPLVLGLAVMLVVEVVGPVWSAWVQGRVGY